jgi:hypothetical protein
LEITNLIRETNLRAAIRMIVRTPKEEEIEKKI